MVFLYTPIRAKRDESGNIEIYDIFGRNNATISSTAGGLLNNRAIKKEIANYGSLSTYISIVKLLD